MRTKQVLPPAAKGKIMSEIEKLAPVGQPRLVRCSCGCATFTRRTKVTGYWETTLTVDDNGRVTSEGNGDSVRELAEPKTVRCDDCGKRYPNPDG
jgi:acyl-coenzyme A thioesterase PaaI-like protein